MGRRHEQFGDGILILRRHAGTALAAPCLCPEAFERRALDIALHRHGDDHLLALDQILVIDPVSSRRDFGQAWGREFAFDRFQFFAHHGVELHPVAQNGEIFGNRFGQASQFLADFIATKGR